MAQGPDTAVRPPSGACGAPPVLLQGTLLFSLLLLAIWLPLLLFSSGAPTYQVPQLLDVRVAASIGVVTQYSSYAGGAGTETGWLMSSSAVAARHAPMPLEAC